MSDPEHEYAAMLADEAMDSRDDEVAAMRAEIARLREELIKTAESLHAAASDIKARGGDATALRHFRRAQSARAALKQQKEPDHE